jgi:hypothetical protein
MTESVAAPAASPANPKRARTRVEIPTDTPWWRVQVCSAYAGGVGSRVIYDAIARKDLRATRLGGSSRGVIVVHRDWLDEWMRSRSEPRPLRVAK